MLLRTRLVLSVVALLAVSLIAAAAVTLLAVRNYHFDKAEHELRAAAFRMTRADDPAAAWRLLGQDGGAPAFVAIQGSVRFASVDDLPPGSVWPDPSPYAAGATDATSDPDRVGDSDEAFVRIAEADRNAIGWRDWDWLIRASRMPDGRVIVTGTRVTGSTAAVAELAITEVTVTLVVLAITAVLAWCLIRHGMRPLDDMAATAAAIGQGNLSRRVHNTGRSEIDSLGSSLNAMLTRIEIAFAERRATESRLRRFVADASHELRTPIASIRGYAELFRKGACTDPRELAMTMRRIENEAQRMGVLVEELLLLARLDQGRPVDRRAVDLAEVAAESIAAALAVEPDRPLTLELEAECVMVNGDADRLRQLLDNLLANVRRHTAREDSAVVRLNSVEGTIVIEVADTGPGLTLQQQQHVFERFYRASESRSRETGGVGLGLAIVAAIAVAHGGSAEVSSRLGFGATFRVHLPEPASFAATRLADSCPGHAGPTDSAPAGSTISVPARMHP